MSAKQVLDSVDLSELKDEEILELLGRVSEDLKRRNNLFPQTGGAAAVAGAIATALGSGLKSPRQ